MLITHDLGVVAESTARVVVMYAGKVVEEADVYNIFEKPLHPYTVGLLQSIPRIDLSAEKKQRLHEIDGVVPITSRLPAGCLFHPRCPRVMDVCSNEIPELKLENEGHKVRCWLYR
jgi:peptide/nickel transport system ATP-binding protein